MDCRRRERDRIILSSDGAEIDDQIATFEQQSDGTWHISEDCDGYFCSTFTADEVEGFAKHLLYLIHKHPTYKG